MHRLALPHFPAVADARAAAALQRELAGRVRLEPLTAPPRTIAGTDLAFDTRAGLAYAAVVIVDAATLAPVAAAAVTRPVDFPYVPGLLSFREIPALLDCLERLGELPDLFLCDGQGIAHPRGFGLAAHLGVLLDRPSIGCAKSRLVGEHAEPPAERGGRTELLYAGRVVGTVLRTRRNVRPLYVSPGHRVAVADAAAFVLATARRFRLPEPIRLAHRLAADEKSNHLRRSAP